MRFLLIFPSAGRGGAEEYALKIASEAVARRWDVHAAFCEGHESELLKVDFKRLGVTYHPLDIADKGQARLIDELTRFFRMAMLIIKLKPDRAHVTLPWPDRCTGPLIALSVLRVPTLVVFQLCPWIVPIKKWVRNLRVWGMKRNQRWVSASRQNRKVIAEMFAVNGKDVEVIYNSAKIVHWEAEFQEACRKKLRAELGIADNSIIILTVGRLDKQKGYKYLLEAAQSINIHDRAVYFAWAGGGPLRGALEKDVEEVGLKNRVFFLGNRVDVMELLLASDMFALASTHEGGAPPFAVMEAVSCKLPFIVSEATNAEETFVDGEDCLICKSEDSASLAEKLTWAIENTGQMRRMAESAYRKFSKYTEGDMASKTLDSMLKIAKK